LILIDVIRDEFGTHSVGEIFEVHGESAFRQSELALSKGDSNWVRTSHSRDRWWPARGTGAMENLLSVGRCRVPAASVELLFRRIWRDAVKRNDLPMLRLSHLESLTDEELAAAKASALESLRGLVNSPRTDLCAIARHCSNRPNVGRRSRTSHCRNSSEGALRRVATV